MDRAALQRRLQEAENTVQRAEESIAFQQRMIAMLDRSAHDVMAAKMFPKGLEARLKKYLADRDRLFLQVANRS
jgi:hypothetical protein